MAHPYALAREARVGDRGSLSPLKLGPRVINKRVEPSAFNFWRNFVVDVVTGAAYGYFGLTRYSESLVGGAGVVLVGFLVWPPVEYLVHRYVLHGPWLALRKDHTLHHRDPKMTRLTGWYAHPLTSIAVVAPVAAISSLPVAALLMTGVYVGYTWFRVVHRIVHFHEETVASRLLRTRLSLHEKHHDRPDRHFGVTSSVLDRVFGTFRTS